MIYSNKPSNNNTKALKPSPGTCGQLDYQPAPRVHDHLRCPCKARQTGSKSLHYMIITITPTDQATDEIEAECLASGHPASCDCTERKGFMYDIYDLEDLPESPDDVPESDDGGLCTGTEADAVGMACAQAIALIARRETLERDCMHCEATFITPARRPADICPACTFRPLA